MSEQEKKQMEELANAGGIELTDEQIGKASGGECDGYIHCPRCNALNLYFYSGKRMYKCNVCKTWFTYDSWERTATIVKKGGCS